MTGSPGDCDATRTKQSSSSIIAGTRQSSFDAMQIGRTDYVVPWTPCRSRHGFGAARSARLHQRGDHLESGRTTRDRRSVPRVASDAGAARYAADDGLEHQIERPEANGRRQRDRVALDGNRSAERVDDRSV